jgi:hypothetical protein
MDDKIQLVITDMTGAETIYNVPAMFYMPATDGSFILFDTAEGNKVGWSNFDISHWTLRKTI